MEAITNIYIGEIHSEQGWTYFQLRPHSIYTVFLAGSSMFSLLLPSHEQTLLLAMLGRDTWLMRLVRTDRQSQNNPW